MKTPLTVELGHGGEAEQTRSRTLPPAAPIFATQPSAALSQSVIRD